MGNIAVAVALIPLHSHTHTHWLALFAISGCLGGSMPTATGIPACPGQHSVTTISNFLGVPAKVPFVDQGEIAKRFRDGLRFYV